MNPDSVFSTTMFDEPQCADAAGTAAEVTAGSDPSWPVSSNTAEIVEESSSASPSRSQEGKHLGRDFTPGVWDVVCGRSKHHFKHVGNRRLRVLIANNLKGYAEAQTRRGKSAIINRLAEQFHGRFARRDKDGCWMELTRQMVRSKVAHDFRDALLKSSRKQSNPEGQLSSTTWVQAQNEIFTSLNLLHKSTCGADEDTESTCSGSNSEDTAVAPPPGRGGMVIGKLDLPCFSQSLLGARRVGLLDQSRSMDAAGQGDVRSWKADPPCASERAVFDTNEDDDDTSYHQYGIEPEGYSFHVVADNIGEAAEALIGGQLSAWF